MESQWDCKYKVSFISNKQQSQKLCFNSTHRNTSIFRYLPGPPNVISRTFKDPTHLPWPSYLTENPELLSTFWETGQSCQTANRNVNVNSKAEVITHCVEVVVADVGCVSNWRDGRTSERTLTAMPPSESSSRPNWKLHGSSPSVSLWITHTHTHAHTTWLPFMLCIMCVLHFNFYVLSIVCMFYACCHLA